MAAAAGVLTAEALRVVERESEEPFSVGIACAGSANPQTSAADRIVPPSAFLIACPLSPAR